MIGTNYCLQTSPYSSRNVKSDMFLFGNSVDNRALDFIQMTDVPPLQDTFGASS